MNTIEVLEKIIRERRSIFPAMYTGESVSDDLIIQLIENANWAPTHRHTEPWRWHVYTGEALDRLSTYAADWYETHMTGDSYSSLKHNKIKKNPLKASHIIAICMKRDPTESVPEWEEVAAVACAVQNMWLMASILGLGVYWSSPKYALEAGEFIGLQEGESCLGLFYIGVPRDGLELPAKRSPAKDKTIWHRA